MFANLIESQSHGKEFKRRGRFVIATAVAYSLLFFASGIVGIYAYDARVEAQTSELELLNWVPPVTPAHAAVPPQDTRPIHRAAPSNAPVDPNIRVAERTNPTARVDDPTRVPDHPGVTPGDPPVIGPVRLSNRNADPPGPATDANACVTCSGNNTGTRVEETTTPPTPQPPKTPTTQKVSQGVLMSKVINLPQPPYPPIARQIHIGGAVAVQILVDEQGKVISAQVVSGHPTLATAARDAALRARFTPTLLSGQPVKVQGTIIYNFVLQ